MLSSTCAAPDEPDTGDADGTRPTAAIQHGDIRRPTGTHDAGCHPRRPTHIIVVLTSTLCQNRAVPSRLLVEPRNLMSVGVGEQCGQLKAVSAIRLPAAFVRPAGGLAGIPRAAAVRK